MEVSSSTKTPIYDVKVNNELVSSTCAETIDNFKKRILYRIKIDCLNKIEIELKNKDPLDTKTIDNEIVEDLLIIVEQLKIDSIDFTKKIPKISQYKDTQNCIHFTNGYITFNGIFTIKFHKNILYTDWLSGFL